MTGRSRRSGGPRGGDEGKDSIDDRFHHPTGAVMDEANGKASTGLRVAAIHCSTGRGDADSEYDAGGDMRVVPGTDALSFIISENLNRRHQNESQRAVVAARLANMTRSDAGAIGNVAQGNATANLRLRDKVSTETAASMLNVGKRSV
ncbi:MAG TPA: hypothetical protein PK200_03110, partial [Spirochaetota bacterium]|nr:hypothetical protein [Spirochaetota bacterium]